MPQKQYVTDALMAGEDPASLQPRRMAAGESGPGRRAFLRAVLLGGATVMTILQITGCSPTAPEHAAERPATDASPGKRILLAYFSRQGENYSYGGRTNLKIGNTEVLAGMIGDRIACDVHRIEAVDPYLDDYDETVARNAREQEADARPAIANPLSSIHRYDTVLLGSPIWNVRAPVIMSTFTERLDFRAKTVFPFTTHPMSGLGTTKRDYGASCRGATVGEGLAVRGEEVREAGAEVQSWLRRIGVLGE